MGNGITVTINAETREAASKVEEFFKGAGEGLEKLSGASEFLRELAGKIAAVFTVGALAEFTKEAIDAAENLKILSRETGLSIDLLSGLREEALKTRAGFEGVSGSLQFFARQLGEAERRGGDVRQVFRELVGDDLLEKFATGGAKIDEVLRKAVEGLNKIQDPARKAVAASEIFSRSWRNALEVFSQGGLEGRGPITEEMVRNADEFNRGLRELKVELEAIFVRVAGELLPALKSLVEKFKELNEEWTITGTIAEFLGQVIKGTTWWLYGIAVAAEAVAGDLKSFFDLGMTGFRELATSAYNAGLVIFDAMTGHPFQALKDFKKLLGDAKGGVEAVAKAFGEAFSGSTDRRDDALEKWLQFGAKLYLPEGRRPGRAGGESSGGSRGGSGAPLTTEAEELVKTIDKAFAEASKGRRALLDQEEENAIEDARKKINNEQDLQISLFRIEEIYAAKRRELLQQEADAEIQIELAKVQGRRHLVEQDPTRTENDKQAELLVLLAKEHQLLEQNIKLYEKYVASDKLTPEAKLAAEKRLTELRQANAENETEVGKISRQGTFSGEFKTVLKELGDEWGSWAKQMASTFKTVFEGAVHSISNGITDLIMGTKSWAAALREIGTSVLRTIIEGIIEMGVRWVLTHVIMEGASKAFAAVAKALRASDTADTVAQEAAKTPVLATNAALSSTTSYGAAAWIGIAALVAALGIGIAAALGAFEEGGYTGAGGSSQVAGVVHRGEYVFSAPAVQRIGLSTLEAMHMGGDGTTGPQDNGTSIHLAFHGGEAAARRWAESREGRAYIVDMNKRSVSLVRREK